MSDLREQASALLTKVMYVESPSPTTNHIRPLSRPEVDIILDALQPLFDQVEREKAQADEWRQALDDLHVVNWVGVIDGLTPRQAVSKLLECALDQERDDLRAKLTQLEARLGLRSWDVEAGQWVPLSTAQTEE